MRRFLPSLFMVPVSLAMSAALSAQTLAPVTATLAPGSGEPMLRVGTQVPLRLVEDLTTKGKQLHTGQRFHMEVAEAVSVNGALIIPVGSPALGEITDVRNKGMWGKSGHLAGRVLFVTVNGRQIRLAGTLDDKGVAGGWGAAATSAIVFAPAGFFMTGTSAHLPSGTPVRAFIDEDVPLTLPGIAQKPEPLVVGSTPKEQSAGMTAAVAGAPAVDARVQPVAAGGTVPPIPTHSG